MNDATVTEEINKALDALIGKEGAYERVAIDALQRARELLQKTRCVVTASMDLL